MAFWKKSEPAAVAPPQAQTGVEPAAPVMPAPPAANASAEFAQPAAPEMTDEARKNAAALSKAVMAAFGQIITVLMRTQEHKAKTLADLEWFVLPAVGSGQFAVAEAHSKTNGILSPVGVVFGRRYRPKWTPVCARTSRSPCD